MPTKVFTGTDILNKHRDVFSMYGNRCLIITSASAAKKSGALDDVISILDELGCVYQITDEIKENPSVKSCIEAGRKANEFLAEYIIGIGGGSVLDAAKTAATVATNSDLTEEALYKIQWHNKPLPLILIGTTAGTGSEVTSVSVMTNKSGMKKSIHHDDFYPLYAFGDPKYTVSMPYGVRCSTAIDALAHLTESYFCNKANSMSKCYSLEGVRKIIPFLYALKNKEELNEEQLLIGYDASILGGMAINITGTTFAHTLGYYFTEHYHLPHGVACAIFMGELIDFEYKNNKDYCQQFFNIIQMDKEEFKQLVNDLLPSLDIQMTLSQIEEIMPRYTNNNSVKNTYGQMQPEDIKEILVRRFV